MRSSCLSIPLVERKLLTKDYHKKVFHLSFDVTDIGLNYEAGDTLGIYPNNDPGIVTSFIDAFNLDKDKVVYFSRENSYLTFEKYLIFFANLDRIPFICKSWLELKYNQDFSKFRFHELFSLFKGKDFTISEQQFVDSLGILLPRFYSIASYCSPTDSVKKIDLLVSLVVIKESPKIFGTCSNYLCSLLPLNKPCTKVFLKKSKDFSLSTLSEDKPIIMIGTGAGLAPFRGFLQKRRITSPYCGNYLFFGEHHFSFNFYYKDFFDELINHGILKIFCAFSRDQKEKVYVQHLLLKQKNLVLSVLDKYGYIFVCGSKELGNSIDITLLQILEENYGLENAKKLIKELRFNGCYVKDVY